MHTEISCKGSEMRGVTSSTNPTKVDLPIPLKPNLRALCKISIESRSSITLEVKIATCQEAKRCTDSPVSLPPTATGFLCEFGVLNQKEKRVEKHYSGLLTNHHVIKSSMLSNIDKYRITFTIADYPDHVFTLDSKNILTRFTCKFLDATFIEFDNNLVRELKAKDANFLSINTGYKSYLKVPDIDSELIILQHPHGGKAMIAKGTLIESLGIIIKHKVSTEEGSSGSLVFTSDGEVVALHVGSCKIDDTEFNIATCMSYILNAVLKHMAILKELRISVLHCRYLHSMDLLLLKKMTGLTKIGSNQKLCLFNARDQFQNYDNIWFKQTKHFWYWTVDDPQFKDELLINWIQMHKNWTSSFASKPQEIPQHKDLDVMNYLLSNGDAFLNDNGFKLKLNFMSDVDGILKQRKKTNGSAGSIDRHLRKSCSRNNSAPARVKGGFSSKKSDWKARKSQSKKQTMCKSLVHQVTNETDDENEKQIICQTMFEMTTTEQATGIINDHQAINVINNDINHMKYSTISDTTWMTDDQKENTCHQNINKIDQKIIVKDNNQTTNKAIKLDETTNTNKKITCNTAIQTYEETDINSVYKIDDKAINQTSSQSYYETTYTAIDQISVPVNDQIMKKTDNQIVNESSGEARNNVDLNVTCSTDSRTISVCNQINVIEHQPTNDKLTLNANFHKAKWSCCGCLCLQTNLKSRVAQFYASLTYN